MTVANALAYHSMQLISTLQSFMIQPLKAKTTFKICFITLFLAYKAAKRERERKKSIYLEKKSF